MPSIGIIADTHFSEKQHLDPRILDFLSGVELIIHAGDVGTLADFKKLEEIAPVVTVMGNKKLEQRVYPFPRFQIVCWRTKQIYVHHGFFHDISDYVLYFLGKVLKQYLLCSYIIAFRLRLMAPKGTHILIFGHTHYVFLRKIGNTLVVNPGASHPKRARIASVAKLTISEGQRDALTMLYLL